MNLYSIWSGMKTRCLNPRATNYKYYGGRGIKVCDEWLNNFQAFFDCVSKLEHFGEEGYTLDRIDNDGDYCPGNLRWADKKTQQRNTRNNHLIECDGEQMTMSQAAERSGVNYNTLARRIYHDVPAEELLCPARKAGWRKPEGVRPQKQMRAYPEEWELIQRFARLVKYSDKQACIKFLESQESK